MRIKGDIISKLESVIGSMETGQEAFTHPWALLLESCEEKEELNVYLNLKAPLRKTKEGWFILSIKRIGPEKTDFEVDVNIDYKWDVYERGCYSVRAPSDYVLVSEVGIF